MLKFFHADICCSPLLFSNFNIIGSPTYLRPTFVWPLHYHCIIKRNPIGLIKMPVKKGKVHPKKIRASRSTIWLESSLTDNNNGILNSYSKKGSIAVWNKAYIYGVISIWFFCSLPIFEFALFLNSTENILLSKDVSN